MLGYYQILLFGGVSIFMLLLQVSEQNQSMNAVHIIRFSQVQLCVLSVLQFDHLVEKRGQITLVHFYIGEIKYYYSTIYFPSFMESRRNRESLTRHVFPDVIKLVF